MSGTYVDSFPHDRLHVVETGETCAAGAEGEPDQLRHGPPRVPQGPARWVTVRTRADTFPRNPRGVARRTRFRWRRVSVGLGGNGRPPNGGAGREDLCTGIVK